MDCNIISAAINRSRISRFASSSTMPTFRWTIGAANKCFAAQSVASRRRCGCDLVSKPARRVGDVDVARVETRGRQQVGAVVMLLTSH